MSDMTGKNDWLERFGLSAGVLPKGARNTICDVEGVLVGHITLADGDVTELVTADGSAVFALVTGRTAADPAEYEKDPELWKTLWYQQKASLQSGAFQQYMAANCRMNQEAR